MKIPLTYGAIMAIAGAVLALSLYLLGFHSDATRLGAGQAIAMVAGLAIGITCIVLAMKARRAELPPNEPFGYGRALGVGVLTALFAALFGLVTSYVYANHINPGFTDIIVQAEIAKLEAKGLPPAQIEQVEKVVRAMSGPVAQVIMGFFGGLLFGTVISLIAAAILKRPASAPPPVPAA